MRWSGRSGGSSILCEFRKRCLRLGKVAVHAQPLEQVDRFSPSAARSRRVAAQGGHLLDQAVQLAKPAPILELLGGRAACLERGLGRRQVALLDLDLGQLQAVPDRRALVADLDRVIERRAIELFGRGDVALLIEAGG